jgi:4-diphosphocytidyl-2-C-methyl-D-erythritol kinase
MQTTTLNQQILWVPSPAKLNLFLHINGRYPNGYHQLQSLFQLLDKGDEIGAEVNTSGKISLKTPIEGVAESENLIFRAARLLQQHTQTALGADLYVKNSLPMGGGIGGGSSNAASVLLTLNYLWNCGLSLNELAELGLALGADVPVFVHGKTAFAEGVGEKLIACPQAQKYFLVATPDVHISTVDVFTHPDLIRDTKKIDINQYDFQNTQNDCETLVSKTHPQVANLLQWLINYAPSRMTGTGASVFSVFDTSQEAQVTLQKLPEQYTGFVARGVNESPLHQCLKKLGAKY